MSKSFEEENCAFKYIINVFPLCCSNIEIISLQRNSNKIKNAGDSRSRFVDFYAYFSLTVSSGEHFVSSGNL